MNVQDLLAKSSVYTFSFTRTSSTINNTLAYSTSNKRQGVNGLLSQYSHSPPNSSLKHNIKSGRTFSDSVCESGHSYIGSMSLHSKDSSKTHSSGYSGPSMAEVDIARSDTRQYQWLPKTTTIHTIQKKNIVASTCVTSHLPNTYKKDKTFNTVNVTPSRARYYALNCGSVNKKDDVELRRYSTYHCPRLVENSDYIRFSTLETSASHASWNNKYIIGSFADVNSQNTNFVQQNLNTRGGRVNEDTSRTPVVSLPGIDCTKDSRVLKGNEKPNQSTPSTGPQRPQGCKKSSNCNDLSCENDPATNTNMFAAYQGDKLSNSVGIEEKQIAKVSSNYLSVTPGRNTALSQGAVVINCVSNNLPPAQDVENTHLSEKVSDAASKSSCETSENSSQLYLRAFHSTSPSEEQNVDILDESQEIELGGCLKLISSSQKGSLSKSSKSDTGFICNSDEESRESLKSFQIAFKDYIKSLEGNHIREHDSLPFALSDLLNTSMDTLDDASSCSSYKTSESWIPCPKLEGHNLSKGYSLANKIAIKNYGAEKSSFGTISFTDSSVITKDINGRVSNNTEQSATSLLQNSSHTVRDSPDVTSHLISDSQGFTNVDHASFFNVRICKYAR